jgi:hypothetical protein
MDEPTLFERSLRGPEKVLRRRLEARLLPRILEFARVSVDDVVNDPRAKETVLALYRVADAGEWEALRGHLAARIEWERFLRANR